MKPLGDRLLGLERDQRLTRPLPEIASSLAHMHMNRLLRARHRELDRTWVLIGSNLTLDKVLQGLRGIWA